MIRTERPPRHKIPWHTDSRRRHYRDSRRGCDHRHCSGSTLRKLKVCDELHAQPTDQAIRQAGREPSRRLAIPVKPVIHDGNEVSIDHLAPMTIRCPCKSIGRELLIDVDFANHCYTEKFVEGVHEIEQIILTEAEDRHRVFCPIRYELSHQLPDLITALPSFKVHQTSQTRNYVYIVPLRIKNKPYEIYFMLQRGASDSPADLRLTVESAYIADDGSNVRKRPNNCRRRRARPAGRIERLVV